MLGGLSVVKQHFSRIWLKTLFGDIKEVFWISKIEVSRDREENIRNCFPDQVVNFDYPNNVDEFNDSLETYR